MDLIVSIPELTNLLCSVCCLFILPLCAIGRLYSMIVVLSEHMPYCFGVQ